jgi:hypothetical protein
MAYIYTIFNDKEESHIPIDNIIIGKNINPLCRQTNGYILHLGILGWYRLVKFLIWASMTNPFSNERILRTFNQFLCLGTVSLFIGIFSWGDIWICYYF